MNKSVLEGLKEKTKPFWEKAFVGKTFKDPELGKGLLKFIDLRQIRLGGFRNTATARRFV